MANIFTNYPEVSDAVLKSDKRPEEKRDKKIKKLKRKIKKQKKIIKKLSEQKFTDENGSDKKKISWNKVGDALLKALPGIFRSAVKAVGSAIFAYVFKQKVQVA